MGTDCVAVLTDRLLGGGGPLADQRLPVDPLDVPKAPPVGDREPMHERPHDLTRALDPPGLVGSLQPGTDGEGCLQALAESGDSISRPSPRVSYLVG